MKKIATVIPTVLGALCLVIAMPLQAQDKGALGKVIKAINDGGGQVHMVPDVQAAPFNFSDYPEYFSEGRLTWDNDVIDTEKVSTDVNGAGVYVAVLDTGLRANWRDYFPEERIATELGRGFEDNGITQAYMTGKYTPNVVESSDFHGNHSHGTHVTSTVIGYSIRGSYVPGVAPQAKIIPVRVLTTYNARGVNATFGTDEAVAAGINYIGGLAEAMPESRFVINMSLGSLSEISDVEKAAVDYAIGAGVIIVASAGNNGIDGMGSPGSYAPVISVGSIGWAADLNTCSGEWLSVIDGGCYISGAFWYQDVPEDASADVSYVSDFSSRELPGGPGLGNSDQELDVLAPGSWVVGPYPAGVGQSHLPWWSNGNGYGVAGQYYFLGGTSMAAPHVAGIAALMMQVNPALTQAEVESILRATADLIPFSGSKYVVDPNVGLTIVEWGLDNLNAVGFGLAQADAAVDMAATP